MLLISELKLNFDENEEILKKQVIKKLRIKDKDLLSFKIYKKSIDARKEPIYKCQVLVNVKNEKHFLKIKNVSLYKEIDTKPTKVNTSNRPIIVGWTKWYFCHISFS